MNDLLDKISHFLGERPGLLPLIGVALIVLNLILQFFSGNWFVDSNFVLHVGLIISIIGLLLINPLR
ncbi:MAG: hypothetical protein GY943_20560 [Chloroflexi bacterium]|nr:hypothetical protein [Chloroflexota bacterium]